MKKPKEPKAIRTDEDKIDGLKISAIAGRILSDMMLRRIEQQNTIKKELVPLAKCKSGKNALEKTMPNIRRRLRRRFYAETDIEINAVSDNWKKYALWLETLATKKINTGLAKENQMLRTTIESASKILDSGITGIQTKAI